MLRPNDTPLPRGVLLNRLPSGQVQPSPPLADMLVAARSNYAWPSGMGEGQSQQVIIDLEADVDAAHAIVERVSCWAENNKRSHRAILKALPSAKTQMVAALRQFSGTTSLGPGLDSLSGLSGVGLVIASKVYRFCQPLSGAAVDRHASYFFNSLDVVGPGQAKVKATRFRREWSTGSHATSRLATYNSPGYTHNRREFIDSYLPLLSSIANAMNALPRPYACAATKAPNRCRLPE